MILYHYSSFDKKLSMRVYFQQFMIKNEIYSAVKEILISEFKIQGDLINPEKLFYDDLDLDSLDAVDLLIYLKDHMTGSPDPSILKNARTIEDVIETLVPVWQPSGESVKKSSA